MHEKICILLHIFEITQKLLKLLKKKKKKKKERIHGFSVYNKSMYNEQWEIYIFRDVNYFVEISLWVSVTKFCLRSRSKTNEGIKTKLYI